MSDEYHMERWRKNIIAVEKPNKLYLNQVVNVNIKSNIMMIVVTLDIM